MNKVTRSPETIFGKAIEIQSPDDRRVFLDQACQGDEELHRAVKKLVGDHFRAGAFLDSPVVDFARTAEFEFSSECPGGQIGPYKMLEQIGEGGFGIVYMAEQTQPVRRKVALKIIKPGMDTRQVVARFEAERQALAMMDHPNIAKVHDAGATENGRPYFVMELVHGVPITTFCDSQRLAPPQRLKLFVDVCRAVQHAHQKGIIHRDLKPSNVMVTMHDDKAVAKVIDFGVSKAISQQLTEKTLFTAYGQMIGTPAYMSPEQAQLSVLDIDTRSDVYSLGVLLYELIAGTTPFDEATLKRAGFDEMRRIIREVDPPRPSERVSTLNNEQLTTLADQRQLDPGKLCHTLRGELDWIVMKALEKDRTRRYESANDLAADIERYLNDEAVEACPPSTQYRLRKFVRRNRGPVLAATLVTLALLGGIIASTWQAVRAKRAENNALASAQAANQSAIAARAAAAAERTAKEAEAAQRRQAKAVSDFLVNAFRRPDPTRDGRTITMVDVLERSAKELHDAHPVDPGTKAALLFAIADSYVGLGLYREAIPLLEQVPTLYEQAKFSDPAEIVRAMQSLGYAYEQAGQADKGVAIMREALQLSISQFGPNHPHTLSVTSTLAIMPGGVDHVHERVTLLENTLKQFQATIGYDDGVTLGTMNNLASAYYHAGRWDKALALYQETLQLHKARLGPDHPSTLLIMNNLGAAYGENNRREEATYLLEETVKRRIATLGAAHPDTFDSMTKLAKVYRDSGEIRMPSNSCNRRCRSAKQSKAWIILLPMSSLIC
jgi:serine/threonine protein kinase